MGLFGTLTETQELEVQGFLSRKEQLKKLAYKVECMETLSEIEEKDLTNSVNNLEAMLDIKNLDKENRESAQILLVTFNKYLNHENRVINLSKPVIKQEIIEKIPEKVANKNYQYIECGNDSPLAYYFKNRAPALIAATILMLIVLFDVPGYVTNFVFSGGLYDGVSNNGVEIATSLMKMMKIVLNVVATAGFGATFLGFTLDLMVIACPFVIDTFKSLGVYETFISDTARLALMQNEPLKLPPIK